RSGRARRPDNRDERRTRDSFGRCFGNNSRHIVKIILATLKKTLFWSYDRGSWQYDVMCVVILAFIFLVPNSVFTQRASSPSEPALVIRKVELGQIEPNNLERELSLRLEQKYGHAAKIARIETAEDVSGEVSYVVYQK